MSTATRGVLLVGALIAAGLAAPAVAASSQTRRETRSTLIDALVFGAEREIDWDAYEAPVRDEGRKYQQRFLAYQAEREPANRQAARDRLEKMLTHAWQRYEDRLAATSDNPRARLLAADFVERLKPCYEWEGFHDCPEGEAQFAEAYQAANPNSPFRDYLPLLAAHRWLCTAEGYDMEERPDGARRTRRRFEAAMTTALRSRSPLVRAAAEELRARGRCFSAEP
jgi:hypothetical protein